MHVCTRSEVNLIILPTKGVRDREGGDATKKGDDIRDGSLETWKNAILAKDALDNISTIVP